MGNFKATSDHKINTTAVPVHIQAFINIEHRLDSGFYYDDTIDGRAQLKKDLEVAYEVVENPKANELFDLAWSHGHSLDTQTANCRRVADIYGDFVTLIQGNSK